MKEYDPVLGGTIVEPILPYADVWWRNDLDQTRMDAYSQLEKEGQMKIDKITFNKEENMVVVEYRTTIPHEWILEELKKRVQPSRRTPEVEQVSMLDM